MGNKTSTIVAGTCGAVSIASYCIYFDRKRRSDPNFKKKLRERRRKLNAAKEKTFLSTLPDKEDKEDVQRFLLDEVQSGEELLLRGDVEGGVEHLSRAVVVCGQPQELLQVLQQTMLPDVFQMLLIKLSTIKLSTVN